MSATTASDGAPARRPVREYEAAVIGGGPAGSATAAVLAQKGRRVAVIEREKFPRYHIGESLIPYTHYPLERLGMIPKLKESAFVKKYSVQFASQNGKVSQPFYFFQHLEGDAAQTWQVWRCKFDKMLLENAAEQGAEVFEQTTAKEFLRDGDRIAGVTAQNAGGEWIDFRAPLTIDCTGRDSLAIFRHGWQMRDPKLNKIALWTYYKGAKRDPGYDEGATTVAYLPNKGWFWYIPLPDDIVSVGITADKDYLYRDSNDPETIFLREVARNKWIEDHLAPGERAARFRVTGDFSYRARYSAADGLVLAGDAFGFLDPVFSSGVFLALRSGEMVAEAADEALSAGDVSAERFREYSDELCYGIESMRKLVYAFYDRGFSFAKVVRKNPDLRRDLTDCLIGNLWLDFDPLFEAVAEFADVPKPLPHGRPLTAAPAAAD